MQTGYEIDPTIEHVLQKEIVGSLLHVSSLSFSKLKPKNVESNLFMYHLRRLMAQHVVEKFDQGYRLTKKGKAYVDRASLSSLRLRVQPKMLTILGIQRSDGQWLILEHLHQPYLHTLAYPSGKVHYGENIYDSAQRELTEKSGLTDVELTLRGNIIIRFFDNATSQRTVNHISGYVFTGNAQEPNAALKSTKDFRAFWGEEALLFGPNTFKGNKEISDLLKQKSFFIESYDFVSDY